MKTKAAPRKRIPKEVGDVFQLNAVSVSELAKLMDAPRQTVYDRIKTGRLRSYRLGRAHVVRRVDAINALSAEADQMRADLARLDSAVHALKTGG